jgi:hypothetical protein
MIIMAIVFAQTGGKTCEEAPCRIPHPAMRGIKDTEEVTDRLGNFLRP